MAEKYLISIGDEDVTFELQREDGRVFVRREDWDEWKEVELERVGDSGLYLLMVASHPIELYLERRRGGAVVTIGRHQFNLDVAPWRPGGRRRRGGGQQAGLARIVAPMTGSIVEVRCAAGDSVEQGDVVLVIESMKMNNELRAPAAGVVETVSAAPGQKVKANDLLLTIRSGGGDGET